MKLDRYSIDEAANYLKDQLDQGFTREHVLLLGSNGELAVGAFTDDGRPIFLRADDVDCFRSDSGGRLPVILKSGSFRTAEEVLAGVYFVEPSDRHPDGLIDGWLDTFPGLEYRIDDIKALSIPAEELGNL